MLGFSGQLTFNKVGLIIGSVVYSLPFTVQPIMASFEALPQQIVDAARTMRASFFDRFFTVIVPLLKPALIAALVYSFARAMTTVSAVIFLVTAENELATTYIIGRVGNGDYGVALAYCTVLILVMSLIIGLIQWAVGERKLGRRKGGATAVPATAA